MDLTEVFSSDYSLVIIIIVFLEAPKFHKLNCFNSSRILIVVFTGGGGGGGVK